MGRRFMWTPAQRRAFELECEGRLTQAEIAAAVGTTRRTVEGWVRRPAWRAAAEAQQEAFIAAIMAEYGPKAPPDPRTAAEREVAEEVANARAWVDWKMACHAAQRAHRKLPPKPPGVE